MKLTEPIRDKNQVAQLIMYYFNKGQMRNYLLITLCLHTALRISDVLSLKLCDVYDFQKRRIRQSITITEKKTGKSKSIALHKNIITALNAYFTSEVPEIFKMSVKQDMPLIRNKNTNKALSRVQAYRIIRAAAEDIGLPQRVSCHSLRKTFGYHAWKDGISPVVIMEIFNHSSLKITQRYLGINQEDKDDVYLGLAFNLSFAG